MKSGARASFAMAALVLGLAAGSGGGSGMLYGMIAEKALFLKELEPVFSAEQAGGLAVLARAAEEGSMGKEILEMVAEEVGEENGGGRVVEGLRRLVAAARGRRPQQEKEIASRLESATGQAIADMRMEWEQDTHEGQVRISEILDWHKESFRSYMRSVISSLLPQLEQGLAGETLVARMGELVVKEMAEYLGILGSVKRVSWSSESNSFDGVEITRTRPGFGMVAQLEPGQAVHRIRDRCRDILLLKTRDAAMHVTIFQVFIMFEKAYRPDSLPSNLLERFREFMEAHLREEIDEVGRRIASGASVELTRSWAVLGREYPSHLVIKVKCAETDQMLSRLKHRANGLGYKWMAQMGEELGRHGLKGHLGRNAIGASLEGEGWRLIIGYTSNKDYKTHVTLGILRSGDEEYDRLVVQQHGDAEREIGAEFSAEGGSLEKRDLAVGLKEGLRGVVEKALQKLPAEKVAECPELRRQVENAKKGRAVSLDQSGMSQWSALVLDSLEDRLGHALPGGEGDIGESLRVSRIGGGVINMDRIQNFEPVE